MVTGATFTIGEGIQPTISDESLEKDLKDLGLGIKNIIKKLKFSYDNKKLPTPIGLEYTFVNRFDPENSHKTFNIYNVLDDYVQKKRKKFKAIHYDNGVVEIPSPVHQTVGSIFKFYRELIKLTEEFNLVPYVKGHVTGGCHIHLDIPKARNNPQNPKISVGMEELRSLYIDIANRPYLNWIFNEPFDNINANSFFSDPNSYAYIKRLNELEYFDINSPKEPLNFNRKHRPIRTALNYNTVEYRIFDMIRNEKELDLIIHFICNYYEALTRFRLCCFDNQDFPNNLILNDKTFTSKLAIKSYLKEFEKLLLALKLKPEDYKVFIKRNYNTRIKWGKKYLK